MRGLRDRSGGICEICGKRRATNHHHRKNRSGGRDDDLSNALHLCGSGTTGCHGWVTTHPEEARKNGWSVSRYEDPEKVPVLMVNLHSTQPTWMLLKRDGTLEFVEFP